MGPASDFGGDHPTCLGGDLEQIDPGAGLDQFSVRGGYLGNRVIAVAESGLDG